MKRFSLNQPIVWVLLILVSASGSVTADAADSNAAAEQPQGLLPVPEYGGELSSRAYLTGDWNGKRSEWADKGIQLGLEYLHWVGSVVDGGLRDDTESGGNLTYKFKWDLMRAGILPGALIDIRAETRYGNNTNPNSATLEPHFTASLPPVDYSDLQRDADFSITNFTYTQFLSEHFGLMVGKMDMFENGDLNEFASGRGRTQFMNYNFVFGSPTLLVPASTMVLGAVYMPNHQVSISSVLASATDCSYNSCVDDAYDDGTIWANAATFQYRMGGLPGGANINTVYYFDTEFTTLGSLTIDPGDGQVGPVTSTEDESWIVVLSAWQYLSAADAGEGPLNLFNKQPDLEGWGIFGRLSFADDDTNPFKTNVSLGIGGRGIFASRPDDVFGVGIFYNEIFSSRFTETVVGLEDSDQGLEAFYNFAITPAAKLTLDLQYLESALQDVDDATTLYARLHLIF